jgi:hypothetical protein
MNRNSTKNLSRGAIHFHRLFSLQQLAIGNCEPFTDRIIRKFLEIGEAVNARWIEMPRGILLLQMVPGRSDTGAIYLYDRQKEVFYLIGFDGPEDNLTLEEFNQLLSEYRLIQYAEQPSLIHSPVSAIDARPLDPARTIEQTQPVPRFILQTIGLPQVVAAQFQLTDLTLRMAPSGTRHIWLQSIGTA